MNALCFFRHAWDGCPCRRCGALRDRDHDWDHCRCLRCGTKRFDHHAWQGCVCRLCQAQRHHWNQGICESCGVACPHPTMPFTDCYDPAPTAHDLNRPACWRCGLPLP